MTPEFRQSVWKGQFKPTEEAVLAEETLMARLGFTKRYEVAQLMIGRSLAERAAPPSIAHDAKFGKPIPGEHLLGDETDLWICVLVMDGHLGIGATVDNFRSLVEAHWARGAGLLMKDWEHSREERVMLARRLSDFLPEAQSASPRSGVAGPIELVPGSVGTTHPDGEPVRFVINGPGTSPHIALMGRSGSGRTTAGVQLLRQLTEQSGAPFLFVDPKGEFVEKGVLNPDKPFADFSPPPRVIEVGLQSIPLDFAPDPAQGRVAVQNAARQLCDSVTKCCKSPGDIQRARLLTVIEASFADGSGRDFAGLALRYQQALEAEERTADSISSLLGSLSNYGTGCFAAQLPPAEFFAQSWIISLKTLPDDLRRLCVLVLLDATKTYLRGLNESAVTNDHRSLSHLLVVDEARKFLRESRSESLVEIVREMRSKGSCVMLLSQDPSDFEGEADDFTTQLGTVIGFSCNQSRSGLRALRGVFGRALQESEFSDSTLPPGVAFCKLPGRLPERIRCWGN